MVVVIKKKGDTKDSLFRKFGKMFMEEDIVNTIRDRLFYKKPSLKRKEEEKKRAQKRRHPSRY